MVYIPKRTYETAEIPEAIVKEKIYIKPILKTTTSKPPNNNHKTYMNYLLYLSIFLFLCTLLT